VHHNAHTQPADLISEKFTQGQSILWHITSNQSIQSINDLTEQERERERDISAAGICFMHHGCRSNAFKAIICTPICHLIYHLHNEIKRGCNRLKTYGYVNFFVLIFSTFPLPTQKPKEQKSCKMAPPTTKKLCFSPLC
jgi:hypothetical protein